MGENTGSATRSGTVTIGTSRTVPVSQFPPTPPNRPPLAVADTATTPQNTPVSVSVLANDSDPDVGDVLRVAAVVSAPTHGAARVSNDARTITYTPSFNWTGVATFRYRVADQLGRTAEALVTVTVEPGLPPCPPPLVTVEPPAVKLGYAAASAQVQATIIRALTVGPCDPVPFLIRASQPWITVAPTTLSAPLPPMVAITISVTEYRDSDLRSGTVTIGGWSVGVSQGCPASPEVAPQSVSLGATVGQSASVTLREAASCSYNVTETLEWLGATPTSVAGNEMVAFTTELPNDTAAARVGMVAIGGTSVRITQTSCPPSPPRVLPASGIFAPDTGGTFLVGVPDANACSWSVSDDQVWIETNQPRISGLEKVAVVVRPNDGEYRTGVVSIGALNVPISQAALSDLTKHRDRLLLDWATRRGHDVCDGWKGLNWSAHEVFIWNTHRLSKYGIGDTKTLLGHVTKLYSITGKEVPDGPRSWRRPEGQPYVHVYVRRAQSQTR